MTDKQTQALVAQPVRQPNPLRNQISEGERSAKDKNSRVKLFCDWLDEKYLNWFEPDLAAWRDYLLEERDLSPTSARAYLSTVRGAYDQALRDNHSRDLLFGMLPDGMSPADRKAYVDEILVRLQNAIHPTTSHVKVIKIQDSADSEHLRLTIRQAEELINSPNISDLQGLRDVAAISVLLCTGLREAELCNLRVEDMRQYLGGELALRVQHGKGMKARLVPYGEMDWCLHFVDAWLRKAQIEEGYVFRGLYKPTSDGDQKVRKTRLSMRSVQRILRRYPISGPNNDTLIVRPHDCRRTYARRLFDVDMELIAIQQNLGHSDVKTTLRYIGELEADKRRGRGVFNPSFNTLSQLKEL